MSLYEETIQLLVRDKGNWPTTAQETGLGREWLAKLANRKIDDPGVNKIESLNRYLRGKYPDHINAT